MNARSRVFGIFTERQVGIGSAAAALEPYLRGDPAVRWTDVTYSRENGLLERLPIPPRLSGTLRGYLQTGSALTHTSYDALLFLTHNPAVFRQRAMLRTPTLLWTDVTPALLDAQAEQYSHPTTRSSFIRAAKHALVRRCFRRAALCVAWSEWARRSFVDHYGVHPERTAVLPPGVDLSHWQPPQERTVSKPRLLFVGGDFERKGGELLRDVFRHHLRGRCELEIVTRAPISEEAGIRVHRGLSAGSPALLELYRTASLFVLPTRGDCFSIASLEAMAMGLPVVTTAVGGIPEIIDSGRSGYVIPPDDGLELRRTLEMLLSDPDHARACGRAARAEVERRFDARKTAQRLMTMLESLASEPGVSLTSMDRALEG